MEAMSAAPEAAPPVIEWAVAARPFPGEVQSGDLHLVAPFPAGVLIAVADGLGHGPEAAAAARAAMAALQLSPSAPLPDLARDCHAALHKSRGVVLGMASIDAARDRMTWLGIGNIDGNLFRGRPDAVPPCESLPSRGGVVGYQLPPLRMVSCPIVAGDVLVLASDGISSRFHDLSPIGWEVQLAADHLLARYARDSDDALVLVVRYLGGPP
jgi:phosphoserine phosphatase RsbX